MKTPYIGITGFMSQKDAEEALNEFHNTYKDKNRSFMVGVLASNKTRQGQTNKWPARFPTMKGIRKVFPFTPDCLNMVHYATDDQETLGSQLIAMHEICGYVINGFQLNITWPPAKQLELYRQAPGNSRMFAGMRSRLVLQINRRAFEAIEHSPEKLAAKIRAEYADLVDDILLDASGGRGELLDVDVTRAYIEAVHSVCSKIGIVIGGGLCAETLSTIEPLVRDFPWLSIDAEGKLRTPRPEDKLDMAATTRYIAAASKLFS